MVALVAALAGLDEHHGPVEAFAIRAGEGHAGSACTTGWAATAIPTHTAVVGPVQASAPAAGIGEAVWLRGLMRTRALPSFLWREKEERKSEFRAGCTLLSSENFIGSHCHLLGSVTAIPHSKMNNSSLKLQNMKNKANRVEYRDREKQNKGQNNRVPERGTCQQ